MTSKLKSCCIYSVCILEDLANLRRSILSQLKFTDIHKTDIKIFVQKNLALEVEFYSSGIDIIEMEGWFPRYSVITHPALSKYKYIFSVANNLCFESMCSNLYEGFMDLKIPAVGMPMSFSSPKAQIQEHMFRFTECRDRNEYLRGFAAALDIPISEIAQKFSSTWFEGWFYVCNRQFFKTSEWSSVLSYCEQTKNYSDATAMLMYAGDRILGCKFPECWSLCESEEDQCRMDQILETPHFYHWNVRGSEEVHMSRIEKFNPQFEYNKWLENIETAYKECQDKKIVLKSYPIRLDIELRNECNFHCIHCSSALRKRGEVLDKKIVNELTQLLVPYVEIIELTKIAEPFYNAEETLSYIERVRKLNPLVVFKATTNGSLLTEDIINRLIDNEFDTLTVSIDCDNKRGFESFRKKSNFEQVIGNLKKLQDIKEKRNSFFPYLHVSCMVNSMSNLPNVMNICNEAGVNSINFGSPFIFAKNEKVHNITKCTSDYYKKHSDELKEQLDECIKLAEIYGIGLSHDVFGEIGSRFVAPKRFSRMLPTISERYDSDATCPSHDAWYRFCVMPSGHVSPCCYHLPYDSIKNMSYKHLRNHIFLQSLRLLLKNGHKGVLCFCKT